MSERSWRLGRCALQRHFRRSIRRQEIGNGGALLRRRSCGRLPGTHNPADALSGLQQLTLSTRGFSFGGTNNALTLDGVTAAQVLARDVVKDRKAGWREPLLRRSTSSPPYKKHRSMNTAREGATATLLLNGKVLIAGGGLPISSPHHGAVRPGDRLVRAFRLDPTNEHRALVCYGGTTSQWQSIDRRGGYGLRSTELYDPATNTFAPPASTPVMSIERGGRHPPQRRYCPTATC